jgi:hypothetical protein
MAAPFSGGGGGGGGSYAPMRAPSYRTMPSEQSLTGLNGSAADWDEQESSYHQPRGFQGGYRQDSVDSFQQPQYGGGGGGGYGYPTTTTTPGEMSWEESYGAQQQYGTRVYNDEDTILRAPSRGGNLSRGPDPNNMAGRGWGGGYGR